MKTRSFRRLTPIGRLTAAIVIAGALCASAWGQDTSPAGPAAQDRNNMVRGIQHYAATPDGPLPPGYSNGPVQMTGGPSFDLEVRNGGLNRSSGKTDSATVGHLVDVLQEKVTNFNVIVPPDVAGVPLSDFKLRGVTLVTVLNILPSITDNKVQARTLVGAARGRRGGPGVLPSAVPYLQTGGVYRLELIPPDNSPNGADSGSGSTAAINSPASARQLAVFNISGYIAHLAQHGKADEKALGIELMGVEDMVGNSLERLKGLTLTPDERPQFEVHYGASIMIVIGSQQAIDVATKIINALPGELDNGASELELRLGEAERARVEDYNRAMRILQSGQPFVTNVYNTGTGLATNAFIPGATGPAPGGGQQP